MKKILIIMIVILSSIGIILFCIHKTKTHSIHSIKKIDSFTQSSDVLDTTTQNSLVLFDVRGVLYIPQSSVFHPKIEKNNAAWLKTLYETTFKDAQKPEDYYWSIWRSQEIPLIVEPNIVQIISSLQDRGVKVLALTSLMSGPDFTIPSLPEWRFNTLKKLELDFSKTHFPDTTFHELPAKKGQHPALYRGILLASGTPKGKVLGAFLDCMKFKPDKIIFFDDSAKRIESVFDEIKKRAIPFYGYKYNGAKFVPSTFSKEIAAFQLKHLVEHEKWLSDQEARALMNTTIKS